MHVFVAVIKDVFTERSHEHSCNPGTQEVGGGASQTPDQLEFHNEILSQNRVREL